MNAQALISFLATYTAENGNIATWFATTPTTPIPTWTSSGSILGAAACSSPLLDSSRPS